MQGKGFPKWYTFLKKKHGNFLEAVERLGEGGRTAGPLDEKTSQPIQLAAGGGGRAGGARHTGAGPAEAGPPCTGHFEFKNVTCYLPDCGGPGNLVPRLK